MKALFLAACMIALPVSASEGLKTPDVLKEKWGQVKDTAILKYEKVRDSDIGISVKRKAAEARNSNFAKNLWSKAGVLWGKALAKGRSLLVSADAKLHEKVLDPK